MRKIIVNGMILTASALLFRLIGVAFSSFVSSRLGAAGMGLYTLIMSVYGFTVTLASAGLNLASTRLCAEAVSLAERRGAMRKSLVWALVSGGFAASLLFFGADFVGEVLLGDARCTPSLRLLALSMPPVALSNVLAGYFTGVRRPGKNAAVGVFEQLFKITVTAWALLYLVPDGIEYACMALVGGGMLAEFASFFASAVLYLTDKGRKHFENVSEAIETSQDTRISIEREPSNTKKPHGDHLTARLASIVLPVASAAIVRSAFSTLEHILIPRGLKKNPLTADTALAAYGVLCGMAFPIIMLPTALLYSFTGLLIPEIAEATSRSRSDEIDRIGSQAVKLTLTFSIGCAGFFFLFADELGMLVYKSSDCGQFIRVMSALVPLMYLDHAVDAILKGLGEQLYCMRVNILDSAMCTLLVFLLCERMGIWGYVVTVYVSELANVSLSLWKFCRRVRLDASVGILLKPMLAVLVSCTGVGFLPIGGVVSLICRAVVYIGLFGLMSLGFAPRRKFRRATV